MQQKGRDTILDENFLMFLGKPFWLLQVITHFSPTFFFFLKNTTTKQKLCHYVSSVLGYFHCRGMHDW